MKNHLAHSRRPSTSTALAADGFRANWRPLAPQAKQLHPATHFTIARSQSGAKQHFSGAKGLAAQQRAF
jgi:hypothetical protein